MDDLMSNDTVQATEMDQRFIDEIQRALPEILQGKDQARGRAEFVYRDFDMVSEYEISVLDNGSYHVVSEFHDPTSPDPETNSTLKAKLDVTLSQDFC